MTNEQIGRATDGSLRSRLVEIDRLWSAEAAPDVLDALDAERDRIWDEIAGRKHDLEDPSSGLGLHQPS